MIRETFVGTIDGKSIEETYDLEMRCWTAADVRRCAADTGFARLEISAGAEVGIAEDRLLIVAHK